MRVTIYNLHYWLISYLVLTYYFIYLIMIFAFRPARISCVFIIMHWQDFYLSQCVFGVYSLIVL